MEARLEKKTPMEHSCPTDVSSVAVSSPAARNQRLHRLLNLNDKHIY